MPLSLTSPDFVDGGLIPLRHAYDGWGCAGQNISPALHWQGAPAAAQALALTCYDPDAPTGSGWWHWVLVNLPAGLTSLAAAAPALAGALTCKNDYGTLGYGGPCPPPGAPPHRYIFTLFALKEPVPAEALASCAMVGFYLNQLALERAMLTGLFGR